MIPHREYANSKMCKYSTYFGKTYVISHSLKHAYIIHILSFGVFFVVILVLLICYFVYINL